MSISVPNSSTIHHFLIELRIISVGKFLQILSSHFSQSALCGDWNKFASFQLNFLFQVTCSEFDWPKLYLLLVSQHFCHMFPIESRFRVFFVNGEKLEGSWLLPFDGNFTIYIYCITFYLYISVSELRHGNAFSHFCLDLLLAVLRLLWYGWVQESAIYGTTITLVLNFTFILFYSITQRLCREWHNFRILYFQLSCNPYFREWAVPPDEK